MCNCLARFIGILLKNISSCGYKTVFAAMRRQLGYYRHSRVVVNIINVSCRLANQILYVKSACLVLEYDMVYDIVDNKTCIISNMPIAMQKQTKLLIPRMLPYVR